MKKITFTLLTMISFLNTAFSQAFVKETFGTTALTTLVTDWSTTVATPLGNGTQVEIDISSVSDTYTSPQAASGGANLAFKNCDSDINANYYVTTASYNTTGKTNVVLGFGQRKTASFPEANLSLEYNIGAGWVNLPFAKTTSTTWSFTSISPSGVLDNLPSVQFRFKHIPTTTTGCTSSSASYRIDDFTVGENNVLPIQLVYFQINGNHISFKTASESNNAYFEIEKSIDGSFFQSIGRLEGSGTTQAAHLYQFIDENQVNGINYYRLKQVDFDNRFEYSNIISFQKENRTLETKILKISQNQIDFNVFSAQNTDAEIEILDTMGSVMYSQNSTLSENQNFLTLETNLSAGLYILKIKTTEGQFSSQIIAVK